MNSANENKMGTMPIGGLLVTMALPMMLSFFIQALYNMVDSVFVARVSENALTAVSLAFPMQQVMNAIAVGTGVGLSSMIPRAIGMGDQRKANRTANTGIFLNLMYVVIFVLLGIFAAGPFYRMQTDVEEIVAGGTAYLTICWVVCAGAFFGVLFERMLVSSGNAVGAMISQASGAVFNIIFDPLLIFGIGPFPRLGVAGAAWATVLGQVFAACVAFFLNKKKNAWVNFRLTEIFHPELSIIREIYSIGFPSMITIGLTSLCSFVINQILLGYTTTATAVYGIWLKLQNFCFMPAFGMNNAMVPILSYNQAQGKTDRVRQAIRYALTFIISLMILLILVLEFGAPVILKLFNASETMLTIGLPAIRTCVAGLAFAGTCVILSSVMQALRKPSYALILNLMRNFAVLCGLFALLSYLTHDLTKVWLAVPVTEAISVATAILLYRKLRNDL